MLSKGVSQRFVTIPVKRLIHDPFDFRLTRGETSVAILRVQYETAEVAKAVVDNARHFARERLAPGGGG